MNQEESLPPPPPPPPPYHHHHHHHQLLSIVDLFISVTDVTKQNPSSVSFVFPFFPSD
jgi:hypothetical protein